MRRDDLEGLEGRLAGLAAEGARHARPPAPATIRRRSRRRRRRQATGVVLVAVALAGAVVAVRAAQPAPTLPAGPRPRPTNPTTVAPAPSGQLVPWIATPARPSPSPDAAQGPPAVPPGTPACTVGQLQASASWQGATGSLAGAVTFFTSRGRATPPCFLVGYPTITLLDRHGRPLQLTADPRSGKEAPPPVLLRPGLAAQVEFAWLNWCGPKPGPIGLRVTLPPPRGGTLVPTVDLNTRRDLTPRCDAPAAPSRLSRGPFVARAPELPPDPLSSLRVRVTLPPSVVAGRPLHYTVTLANPTTAPVSLRDCPSYEERVSLAHGGTAAERHLLNCAPVAAIGPRQQVTFAMVLDLPATLRPGKGVLVWLLLRPAPVGVKVLVTVTGP
jgi:Protein of unknown function (DUF4232)